MIARRSSLLGNRLPLAREGEVVVVGAYFPKGNKYPVVGKRQEERARKRREKLEAKKQDA